MLRHGNEVEQEVLDEYKQRFMDAVNDDLNMPLAMGVVWEVVRNQIKSKQFAELLLEFDKVLGLDVEGSKKYLEEQAKVELPEEIAILVEQRRVARENKDWVESDRIRDLLKDKGFQVKDSKDGMVVERIL